jgi:very-short-patch-repair endonuclease
MGEGGAKRPDVGMRRAGNRATMNSERSKFRTRAARRLRETETSAEDLLWRELRNRHLDGWKFRRQVPIAGCIADFACMAAKLTIEVDGAHHADQIDVDRDRTTRIEAAGYLEIRFTNEDVRGRPGWVIEEIRRVLDTARARPMRPPAPRLD